MAKQNKKEYWWEKPLKDKIIEIKLPIPEFKPTKAFLCRKTIQWESWDDLMGRQDGNTK